MRWVVPPSVQTLSGTNILLCQIVNVSRACVHRSLTLSVVRVEARAVRCVRYPGSRVRVSGSIWGTGERRRRNKCKINAHASYARRRLPRVSLPPHHSYILLPTNTRIQYYKGPRNVSPEYMRCSGWAGARVCTPPERSSGAHRTPLMLQYLNRRARLCPAPGLADDAEGHYTRRGRTVCRARTQGSRLCRGDASPTCTVATAHLVAADAKRRDRQRSLGPPPPPERP